MPVENIKKCLLFDSFEIYLPAILKFTTKCFPAWNITNNIGKKTVHCSAMVINNLHRNLFLNAHLRCEVMFLMHQINKKKVRHYIALNVFVFSIFFRSHKSLMRELSENKVNEIHLNCNEIWDTMSACAGLGHCHNVRNNFCFI